MGRKSRAKKDRAAKQTSTIDNHPMIKEIKGFLSNRNIDINKASGLLYIVSMMSNFLIFRSIKEISALPDINSEDNKADENRMEQLGRALSYECEQFDIDFQETMNELVFPIAGNTMLVKPILTKIYNSLDSMTPTDNFRETTENQIENPEFWGDSLERYKNNKEKYFETTRELFAFSSRVFQSTLEGVEMDGYAEKVENIRKKHGIEKEDFLKLRRRATEFFRIAFATYLRIEFQPLREEVDTKFL